MLHSMVVIMAQRGEMEEKIDEMGNKMNVLQESLLLRECIKPDVFYTNEDGKEYWKGTEEVGIQEHMVLHDHPNLDLSLKGYRTYF